MQHHHPQLSQETNDHHLAYRNFNDPDLKFVAEPSLPDNVRGGIHRVQMNEILGRAAWDWAVSWRHALGVLTHTSGGSLDRYLDQACRSGQIQMIGELAKRHPVGIQEYLYYGRKAVGVGSGGPVTRRGLETPDLDGLTPGDHFLTTKDLLIKAHPFFATAAMTWLVEGFYREDGTVVVAYSENHLRYFFGWFSPKTRREKRPKGPAYCTEVPDGLLHFEGLTARLEFQRTQKEAQDYAMKCAACYGEPVIYVARTEAIYRTLLRAKWGKKIDEEGEALRCELEGEGKPEVKNLFVTRLWNDSDLKKLLADLRRYAIELPYPNHLMAEHYSKPGFVYRTVSSTHAAKFLEQAANKRAGLSFFYETLTPVQKVEIRLELEEKAQQAWTHFDHASSAKSEEAKEAQRQEDEEDKRYRAYLGDYSLSPFKSDLPPQ